MTTTTRTPYTIPAGTMIAVGGYSSLEEGAGFGFGLGAADSARLFDAGERCVDSYTGPRTRRRRTAVAPMATGAFPTTSRSTKGAANDCRRLITRTHQRGRVERRHAGRLGRALNTGPAPVDVSGFSLPRQRRHASRYVIPAGTTIAAGGYLVLDEAAFGFGLGGADSARLFDASATCSSTRTLDRARDDDVRPLPGRHRAFDDNGDHEGRRERLQRPRQDQRGRVERRRARRLGRALQPEVRAGGRVGLDLQATPTTRTPTSIPAGTLIAAGGYLVLDEAPFGFGLGAADFARASSMPAAVLARLVRVDRARATTYGRCPNGTGAFTTTASVDQGRRERSATGPRDHRVAGEPQHVQPPSTPPARSRAT